MWLASGNLPDDTIVARIIGPRARPAPVLSEKQYPAAVTEIAGLGGGRAALAQGHRHRRRVPRRPG